MPFVDLGSAGLRRRKRVKSDSKKLTESRITDANNKELSFFRPKALMILALTAFTDCCATALDSTIHCYQTRIIEYNDFLESNFDGSINHLNPLAHIYMTSQSNNEVYALKEIMHQPDRADFEAAMKKEVASMFEEKIWKRVPKLEMKQFYEQQRAQGINVKREQIMMIWSFKRKRHPDGTLDKHKARLCCHGGQQ